MNAKDRVRELAYWDRLSRQQQDFLLSIPEFFGSTKNILEVGMVVEEIYRITNPYGGFLRYFRAIECSISPAALYRSRAAYLQFGLPKPRIH